VPVAKLVPVPPAKRKSSIFGFLRDRFEIVGDVTPPAMVEKGWETLEEWDQLNR